MQTSTMNAHRHTKQHMALRCHSRSHGSAAYDPTVMLSHTGNTVTLACRARAEQLERAKAHARAGNMTAAYECYQRAVDISPEVAKRLIEVCDPALGPASDGFDSTVKVRQPKIPALYVSLSGTRPFSGHRH